MAKFCQKAKMKQGKQITINVPFPCEVRITQTAAHTFIVEADEWTPPEKPSLILPPSAGKIVQAA